MSKFITGVAKVQGGILGVCSIIVKSWCSLKGLVVLVVGQMKELSFFAYIGGRILGRIRYCR